MSFWKRLAAVLTLVWPAFALAEPGGEALLIVRPGHREGELAKRFAEDVARTTGRNCLVSCGIHVDGITRGEIACAVALGKYVRVADTTLRVFEDGRIGAEIRGIEVNVADNLRALVDLVIGPEGVWGMCTVTADKVFVSETITV